MGMQGVYVNSMTGEGLTLTVEERKTLSEIWFEIGCKYEFYVIVNIGGLSLHNVYELAEHAEKLNFDAVMVMPDVDNKPRTEEDLVYFLKNVQTYMPTRLFFYHHTPSGENKNCKFSNRNYY